MESTFKAFPYDSDECRRHLEQGIRATRLVEILPGNLLDNLKCRLQSFQLNDMPPYQALSYAWTDDDGDKDDEGTDNVLSVGHETMEKHSIVVNDDFELRITAELKRALTAIRKTDTSVALWVDQLCIDQSDINEKSLQVLQMATIYRQAASVILWAGDETPQVESCFHSTDEFAHLWRTYGNLSPENAEVEDHFIRDYPQEPIPSMPVLILFLLRRVFTRGWIVQEVALAKSITVKCGSREKDWDVMAAAIRAVVAIERRQGNEPLTTGFGESQRTSPVMHMLELRDKIQETGPVSLLEGLEALQHFATTDPRDKVFAALALCRPDENVRRILPVDYSLSTAEVLVRASKAIIFGEKGFGGLSCAGVSADTAQNLPSWVADWSGSHRQRTRYCLKVARERGFSAAHRLGRYVSWPLAYDHSQDCPIVTLSSHVTRISHVEGRAAPKGEVGSYTSTVSAWQKAALAVESVYGEERPVRRAFLQTLIYPFSKMWKSEGPIAGKDFEEMRLPGTEDAEALDATRQDYEMNLVQVGLQQVFNTDDESYFYDFKVLGEEGRDKPVFWTFIDGYARPVETLPGGGQIITLEEAANGCNLFSSDVGVMVKTLHHVLDNHCFFVTENGHFGLGPIGLCKDDEIYLLGGADVPMVLRTEESEDITTPRRRFISECYVHGIMYGEALEMSAISLQILTIY